MHTSQRCNAVINIIIFHGREPLHSKESFTVKIHINIYSKFCKYYDDDNGLLSNL